LEKKQMANVKDFTGSVNINDDITPITRQKIDKVTPEKWNQMNSNALWDQRIVLYNRMIMASSVGQGGVAKQIQQGINTIDAILHRNAVESENKETLR
jgi:hypothetical protein